jgi:CRISPR/Cas system-associated exonuclease Cas4 (RecB family)
MSGKQVSGEQEEFRLASGRPITGTLLWYYAICKREVWLMAHSIAPDEENQALEMGL